jgi:hypothetical protein
MLRSATVRFCLSAVISVSERCRKCRDSVRVRKFQQDPTFNLIGRPPGRAVCGRRGKRLIAQATSGLWFSIQNLQLTPVRCRRLGWTNGAVPGD